MKVLRSVGICVCFLLIMNNHTVLAQQEVSLDSLSLGLENSITEADQFYYLKEIYFYWLNNSYDSAEVYADRYLQLAMDIEDQKEESIALNYKGIVYDYREDVPTASSYYNRALEIRRNLGDKRLIGNSLSNLGALYYHAGDYEKASDYYFKAIEIREEIQDSSGLSQSYNNLGILLRNQEEYEQALDYYMKSADLKKKIGREYSAMYTMLNMGSLYIFMKEYENAISISEDALVIANKYQDKSSVAALKLNIGSANTSLKNYREAEQQLLEGIKMLEEIGETSTAFEGYTMLVTNYMDNGNIREAITTIEFLKENLDMIEPRRLQEFYGTASQLYVLNNDYKRSLEMKISESEIKDSLFNASSKQSLLELETKYELSEKEKELALLNTENNLKELELSRSSIIRNFSLFVALLLIVVLFYGARNARIRDRLNKELATSLNEKELLMKEIHHRVKNNLQIISSLLNIQSRKSENESTSTALQESKNRVQSMALIHQSLYQKENITSVQIKDYIEQLLETLMNSFGIDDAVELKTNIQDIELDVDTTIPLGLIINELVTNAVKYAFVEEGGKLSVSLNEFEGILRLEVADNGKGFHNAGLKNESFGMSMVETLSQKLKGELSVNSDSGTSIRLDIKEYKRAS